MESHKAVLYKTTSSLLYRPCLPLFQRLPTVLIPRLHHTLPSTPETLRKRVPSQQFPDPFFCPLSPGCLFLGLCQTVGQYPMDSLKLYQFSSTFDLSLPLPYSDFWLFHKFLFHSSPKSNITWKKNTICFSLGHSNIGNQSLILGFETQRNVCITL